jgi:TonB family protein
VDAGSRKTVTNRRDATLIRSRIALLVPIVFSLLTADAPAQTMVFQPPRVVRATLPQQPAPTVVGGGEVSIEVIIDRRGAVTRPVVLRSTPPYTELLLDAVMRWQFEPARTRDENKMEVPVESSVVIVAMHRAPALFSSHTLGEAPKDLATPSRDVALPTSTTLPPYPPQARDSGAVLLEVLLNDLGSVQSTRVVASDPGFDAAARDALGTWRFRGGSYRARPAMATTYVLFGFRSPVTTPRVP